MKGSGNKYNSFNLSTKKGKKNNLSLYIIYNLFHFDCGIVYFILGKNKAYTLIIILLQYNCIKTLTKNNTG